MLQTQHVVYLSIRGWVQHTQFSSDRFEVRTQGSSSHRIPGCGWRDAGNMFLRRTVARKKKCAPHFFTVHLKKRRFTISQYDGYCRPGFHIAKTILLCRLNFVCVIDKLPNRQNHKLAISKTNWNALPEDLLFDLSDSMPRRIQSVLAVNGWMTKY